MRQTILVLSLLLIAACGQNPYSGRAGVQGPQPPPPAEKPKPPPPPKGTWGLQAPAEMGFTEGLTSTYIIKGTVPVPGLAQISISGLPNGATYDPSTGTLAWLPDYQAANDPAHPLALTRIYNAVVTLSSSADPASSMSQEVLIRVDDVAQPISLSSPLQAEASEGQPLTQPIEFNDPEFPNGPFDMVISGFPVGTQVVWADKTKGSLQITWTPDFTVARNGIDTPSGGHVALYNPRGIRHEFDVSWTIHDTPVAPRVWGPQNVQDAGDVNFFEMAEDTGNEEIPQWDVDVKPTSGDFRVATQQVSSTARLTSMAIVTWRNLKRADMGKMVTVNLKACVQNGSLCTTYPVNITPNAGGGK